LELIHLTAAWIPVTMGLGGALLLMSASVLLILESRIALRAVTEELACLTRSGRECRIRQQLPSEVDRKES
jgi:hypothetical protein